MYLWGENLLKENIKYYDSNEALKFLFGYDEFRPGQKAIIDEIIKGQDILAVMPTGAGKSLCYQIPAVMLSGITLVISPLISLMQDQVKALNEAGIAAAYINSSLSEREYFETINQVKNGKYKIIYVAPERLINDRFLEIAKNIDISMITVDEAHCISQWGQDFRPSYMNIAIFVGQLNVRPIISAFTATATKEVREDIICSLGLENPYVIINGFDRENLFFQVEKPKDKDKYILDFVKEHKAESGIIYCTTRKNVDDVYYLLKSNNYSVGRYHAGMEIGDRKKMQEDFVYDNTSIMVATNAFGMGIDKSNVRYVIHYNMPQSMENYYQEAGRAGRDGLDAKCILLFSTQDIMINRFLLDHKEMTELSEEEIELIKERDTNRLRVMEKYCYTTECLRNYILKYFGENPTKPCNDCGNCLHEFETLDMTEAAKKVINCVYEAKGRYGKTIIINTLTKAKSARLDEIGAVNYKSYGVLETFNKKILIRLIEQMVYEGYLEVGAYQIIKLGDISRLRNPETKVMVSIGDDDKFQINNTRNNKKLNGKDNLTSEDYRLFEELRKLRMEIAREEKVPPYIIFSDKTLVDMASKKPKNETQLLNVSGVGKRKYDRYGEKFIKVIEKY